MRREVPRVLHLATSIAGGAGIAAWRIHEALVGQGVDSQFLTQGSQMEGDVHLVARSRLDRTLQKTSTVANRWVSTPGSILFTPLSRGVLSLEEVSRFEPDIIHVHNWYNFFDWSLAPALASQGVAIVTTMHDERLLTGGCHYTLDCSESRADCGVCPQSRLTHLSGTRRRRAALRECLSASQALLVSPSHWLRERAASLGAMNRNDCALIPNCVSSELLDAAPIARDQGSVSIGFVTGKAPDLVQETLDELALMLRPAESAEIDIICAGEGPVPLWRGGRTIRFGRIDSDRSRASFWDRVNVGLFVSRTDNFPNTILEGLSRGVPQVVADIGGAPEAVKATGGGLIRPARGWDLAEGLVHMVRRHDMRRSAGRAAKRGIEQQYAPRVTAEAYAQAYVDVTRRPR